MPCHPAMSPAVLTGPTAVTEGLAERESPGRQGGMRGCEVGGLRPSPEETPQSWLRPRAPAGEDGGAASQRPCCRHRHTL